MTTAATAATAAIPTTSATRLRAETLSLAYGGAALVVRDLSVAVPDGKITAIAGPNGCGKSTLLRALARLHAPRSGAVLLDGQAITSRSTKEVARTLGLLAQQPTTIDAITVEDLARRGRYPHQSLLQPPSGHDQLAVERALALTGMTDLRGRVVDELSGGQRQRAWIAMALAQETPLLLLDEPTTYLDVAHQEEVLALIQRLNREEGRTIVLVLHDINAAARVSDHVIALRAGEIVAEGAPQAILTPELLEQVFGVACDVVLDPGTSAPVSVPRGRSRLAQPLSCVGCPVALRADCLCGGYGRLRITGEITLDLPRGRISAIVGPNACGKSTLLRTFARLLAPLAGSALLDDAPLALGTQRGFARRLAFLAQGGSAPAGVTVEDLVAVGRVPYQRWYRQWSRADQQAIERALEVTGISDLRWSPVEALSGGQRQRVWLAMVLAQDTEVLLLDEPTTFLDIAHQVEVLDLVWELNRREGRTVVLVLHDLGQACRYADWLVAMHAGEVVAAGTPGEVMTPQLVRDVFGIASRVVPDPLTGKPLVLVGEGGRDGATGVPRPGTLPLRRVTGSGAHGGGAAPAG